MSDNPYAAATNADLQALINAERTARAGYRKIKDSKTRRELVAQSNALISKFEAELRRRRKT